MLNIKKPELSDFNLDTEAVNKANNKEYLLKRVPVVSAYLFSFFAVLLVAYEYRYDFSFISSDALGYIIFQVLANLIVFIIIYYIFVLCFYVIAKIISLFFTNPDLVKYEDYLVAIAKYNNQLKEYEDNLYKQRLNFWFSLSGYEFEIEVETLLRKCNYNVYRTKGSGDEGIDLIMKISGEDDILMQCKAYKKKIIGPAPIRELIGIITSKRLKKGILVCLNGASYNAETLAYNNNIEIWDVKKLINFQNEYVKSLEAIK